MKFKQILQIFNVIKNHRYLYFLYNKDMDQYVNYSCINSLNPECIATNIRLLSHALEKGMSLPNCRKGFGKQKILELIDLCAKYESIEKHQDIEAVNLAYTVIKAYMSMQASLDVDLSFIPIEVRNRALKATDDAGYIKMNCKVSPELFIQVAEHRHSLRYFSDKPLKVEDIYRAVSLAQTAPSACNRQPIRVYAVTNMDKIAEIMQLHGGIRSFGKPTCIFIITSDLVLYHGEYERNTAYVDGGIFTMNLLYALDSVNIASCPAIWGNIPCDDQKLSNIAGISPSHRIINLIVAGYYPDGEYKVAASTKRNTNTILRIIQ